MAYNRPAVYSYYTHPPPVNYLTPALSPVWGVIRRWEKEKSYPQLPPVVPPVCGRKGVAVGKDWQRRQVMWGIKATLKSAHVGPKSAFLS